MLAIKAGILLRTHNPQKKVTPKDPMTLGGKLDT